jgi:hypothetical protein
MSVSRRATASWLVLSVGLAGTGVVAAYALSKSIGDMGDTSFDTTGSRLGLVMAAIGVSLALATVATLPQRLRPGGAALAIAASLVAGWLMISPPTVVAATSAYPVPHETVCRPAAVVHAVAQSSGLTRNRGEDVLAKCRTVSRTRVGVACAGALAAWAFALVWLRRRPVESERTLVSAP